MEVKVSFLILVPSLFPFLILVLVRHTLIQYFLHFKMSYQQYTDCLGALWIIEFHWTNPFGVGGVGG